jgi:hypothetical protein
MMLRHLDDYSSLDHQKIDAMRERHVWAWLVCGRRAGRHFVLALIAGELN